jgi:acylphosphatase
MKKAAILKISGRVQNVGFRYHTRKTAQQLGVDGFVKNEMDGSVYIEAEAEEEVLDQFILWCHKGPAWARVDEVKVQASQVLGPDGYRDGFEVR